MQFSLGPSAAYSMGAWLDTVVYTPGQGMWDLGACSLCPSPCSPQPSLKDGVLRAGCPGRSPDPLQPLAAPILGYTWLQLEPPRPSSSVPALHPLSARRGPVCPWAVSPELARAGVGGWGLLAPGWARPDLASSGVGSLADTDPELPTGLLWGSCVAWQLSCALFHSGSGTLVSTV